MKPKLPCIDCLVLPMCTEKYLEYRYGPHRADKELFSLIFECYLLETYVWLGTHWDRPKLLEFHEHFQRIVNNE